jgi:hypothetical protein
MIDLLLSKQDYETLKIILTIIDPVLERKIGIAKQKANEYVITLTIDELEDLAGYVAAEANHEKNRIRQRKLDRLYDGIDEVLKEEDLKEEEWKERFRRILGEIEDEISEFMKRTT